MSNFDAAKADAALQAPGSDPLAVLNAWYEEAIARGEAMPDAMTLATATRDGAPSARVVLYKGIKRGGIFFVSNYQSRKARELEDNPRAALVMHFPRMERQVRVEGLVERASAAESDEYFASRPRGSQLGAWASPQSQPITSRDELLERTRAAEARFGAGDVSRPEFWGGYLLMPKSIELWLGQGDRLHDRFRYALGSSGWSIERLAP
jgi:pyridoxamine 5'-phosphate oxidase